MTASAVGGCVLVLCCYGILVVLKLVLNDLGLHQWQHWQQCPVLCCSGILLVLKLVLNDLGLVANAGALNPVDVLAIGSQDCLRL
jgi:hypothetical protein